MAQPAPVSQAKEEYAIKTWRYLRLAMVVLVAGLFVSIAVERLEVSPGCWQTSISGYYYTPVQGYFVGALAAIGVCLFCLKGSTDIEDVLLNLAGMFAPFVAFVPTPGTGTCASVLGTMRDRDVNVNNNVKALLAVGTIGLFIIAARGLRNRASRAAVRGFLVAAVAWLAAALSFFLARDAFVDNAHYVAAVAMFICFLVVVGLNAWAFKRKTRATTARNRYGAIATAMLASSAIIIALGLSGWDYYVLAIEFVLITLFAVFWIIQTQELWTEGLRENP